MFISSGIGRRFRKAQETDAADGLDSVIETFAYALATILLERLGSLVGPWGPMGAHGYKDRNAITPGC